jgi:dissimilatory sulfite reductase (desulfoviridin) alpha/beta subunit
MPDFNPFSDEGQLWVETHEVEDQYNSLENLGNGFTRIHSSENVKIQKNPIYLSKQKEKSRKKLANKGLHLFNSGF